MIAPTSGSHEISVTLDLDDAVVEANEDNTFTSSVIIDTRMDLYHFGDLVVTVEEGNLQGPWTISGTLARTDGSGTTEVPMRIEIKDDNAVDIPLPTFYVNITGGSNAQQPYPLTYCTTKFQLVCWKSPKMQQSTHTVLVTYPRKYG